MLSGCFTCKLRKKKCDCVYTSSEATNSQTCQTCIHHGIPCHMTEPEWWDNPEQAKAHLDEQKRLLKQKRKSRDDSVSSGRTSRDRSATIRPTEFSMRPNSVLNSIENEILGGYTSSLNAASVTPRKGMAFRGGRGVLRRSRQ